MSFQTSMRDARIPPVAIFILIGVAALFYVLTIRAGHTWGGDFALYIAHAKNIATGQPYADTGVIYNTNIPSMSPSTYPPVYPAILAPVYRIFGLDLYAMKVEGIAIFTAFLVFFYFYARARLESSWAQLGAVAAIAFSPWFWKLKDSILSDYAFLLFTYAAIVLMDRLSDRQAAGGRSMLFAVVVGLVAYLSYGTRSLGLLLIPALILLDIVRFRTVSRATMVVTLVFAAGYAVQYAELQTDQSYVNSLKVAIQGSNDQDAATDGTVTAEPQTLPGYQRLLNRIWANLRYYDQIMRSYWFKGSQNLSAIVYAGTGVLAIFGFLVLVRNRPGSGDMFFLLYATVLLLVPFVQKERYLLPLVPLYFVYLFRGAETVLGSRSSIAGKFPLAQVIVPLGLLLVTAWSYTTYYSPGMLADISYGVESKETTEMFEFIRRNTPEDSVIIFRKPRPLALMTGRRASTIHRPDDPEELLAYFVQIDASYIVEPKESSRVPHWDYVHDWIAHYADKMEPVFENADFRVYRMDIKS
ncbi:MAG: hypothetical protein BMS9Abin09_0171 [Gammaproteobacteria bacterium]|nr:MAG: hypothetical protein BMS9Abin09_0171 [Gammaproteobacteria bacterium]